jgi:hypothetical protein
MINIGTELMDFINCATVFSRVNRRFVRLYNALLNNLVAQEGLSTIDSKTYFAYVNPCFQK